MNNLEEKLIANAVSLRNPLGLAAGSNAMVTANTHGASVTTSVTTGAALHGFFPKGKALFKAHGLKGGKVGILIRGNNRWNFRADEFISVQGIRIFTATTFVSGNVGFVKTSLFASGFEDDNIAVFFHCFNGSVIHVYPNQFMMLVDGGKIVDFTAEEGYYKVDNAAAPSLFSGGFGASIKESFSRVKFGGVPSTSQKAYFINLQEIKGIKFGTRNPISYFDSFYNAELFLRAHGMYSIKVTDPIKFYTEVIPKNADRVDISAINEQYLNEFLEALGAGLPVVLYTPGLQDAPGNRALAATLAGKRRELKNWGVVFVSGGQRKVITAQQARLMKAQGLRPGPGAVLTPLAKEILEG